jgi:hypothetical protein
LTPHFNINEKYEVCLTPHFNINEKYMENVNKGVHRASKHIELWARNALDEWRMSHGFDIGKFIVNLLESENLKDFVHLFSFVLEMIKKY